MPTRHLQFDGQTVCLDARADRLDPRDRPYAPPLAALPPRWPEDACLRCLLPAYTREGLVLDQSAHGEHGACTGYGLAAVINFLLWQRDGAHPAPVSPHMLYDLARFYDEWPGEEYEGSSCRGAIKGLEQAWQLPGAAVAGSCHADPYAAVGYRPDPRWATDAATHPLGVYYRVDRDAITDMQAALHAIGALYVSASVHAGWLTVAAGSGLAQGHGGLPVIGYDGMAADAGNHAFAIVGYNEYGFVVQNSWGQDWGARGFAILRYDDWRNNGLDCWVAALGVPQVIAASAVGTLAASAPRALPGAALANVATAATKSRRIGVSLAAADPPVLANPALAGALPWSTDTAYAHTLVSGNNGVLRSSRPDIGRAADLVAVAVDERLGAWLRSGSGANGSGGSKKVVIYAHGGLNPESASLRRIRVMGPYFAANGIYPLFYTWRTGVLDTLGGLLHDAIGDVAAPALAGRTFNDAKDGLLETVAHRVRWAWREMQDNAARAAQDVGALVDATAQQPDDDLWRTADWPQVRAWRAWVAALPAQADGVPACEVTGMRMPVSLQRAVKPSHNTFDNDIVILTRTINRVLGRSPDAALAAPVTDLDY